METWRQEVAQTVESAILEVYHGRLPCNIWEWRRVARRFGLTLTFLRVPPPFTAAILDDLLIVRWSIQPSEICRWLTHEIAEAVLIWEGEAPYCYVSPDGPDHTRHLMARDVENYFFITNL